MADTRPELETAVFDLAASVASVRAALSAAITDDVDEADYRLDALEGCYRVLGDAMDSMWTAWARFDQGQVRVGRPRRNRPVLMSREGLLSRRDGQPRPARGSACSCRPRAGRCRYCPSSKRLGSSSPRSCGPRRSPTGR